MNLFLHWGLSQIIAQHLVNGLILSAGVFLSAVVFFLTRNRWSASTRHQILFLLLVVLAFTPVLAIWKPYHQPAPQSEITLGLGAAVGDVPEISAADTASPATSASVSPLPSFALDLMWLWKINWPAILAAIWAGFAAICLVRLGYAMVSLWNLHRAGRPLEWPENIPNRRKIQLAVSSTVSSPVAIGLWSPKILLPAGFKERFSESELHDVLHHEIAHLERLDDWSNLFQQLLIAFFPINPFLWFVGHQLQLEREIACDDWVLAANGQPKQYADLLTRLAVRRSESPLLVAGVSRAGKQLYRRLARILDARRNRRLRPSWLMTFLASASLTGVSIASLLWLPGVFFAPRTGAAETTDAATGDPSDCLQDPATSKTDCPAQPGQSADQKSDPELIALLRNLAQNDPDPQVRLEAVHSLCALNGPEAAEALIGVLDTSKDETTKISILQHLGHKRLADPKVREKLGQLAAQDPSVSVRMTALEMLVRQPDEKAADQVISVYRAANERSIKETCLRYLGRIGTKPAKDFLMGIAKDDPDPELRRAALRAVVGHGSRSGKVVISDGRVTIDDQDLDAVIADGMGAARVPGHLEFFKYLPQEHIGEHLKELAQRRAERQQEQAQRDQEHQQNERERAQELKEQIQQELEDRRQELEDRKQEFEERKRELEEQLRESQGSLKGPIIIPNQSPAPNTVPIPATPPSPVTPPNPDTAPPSSAPSVPPVPGSPSIRPSPTSAVLVFPDHHFRTVAEVAATAH
jgi:beta-lactamase regulating signal transducer with metallopeptidase domain/HEAT repeat protein